MYGGYGCPCFRNFLTYRALLTLLSLSRRRMFAEKVEAFADADFTREDCVAGVLRVAVGCLLTSVKRGRFTEQGRGQLRVDVALLRGALPHFLEDPGAVDKALDAVLASCDERTVGMGEGVAAAVVSSILKAWGEAERKTKECFVWDQ